MGRRVIAPLKWLLPGLGIKRWLVLVVFGVMLLLDGVYRWVVAEGGGFHINEVIDAFVDDFLSPAYLTYVFIVAGVFAIVFGIVMWSRSMVRAARAGEHGLLDSLLVRRLESGYNIVAIGGGTGLSTLLRGLKRRTANLTAIVTVSDDGGS
ncbi:MAG TPA: 2-phospho-L-lactate transferase CofD family protein, partial [Candidatus Aquilonibacter sp.]